MSTLRELPAKSKKLLTDYEATEFVTVESVFYYPCPASVIYLEKEDVIFQKNTGTRFKPFVEYTSEGIEDGVFCLRYLISVDDLFFIHIKMTDAINQYFIPFGTSLTHRSAVHPGAG